MEQSLKADEMVNLELECDAQNQDELASEGNILGLKALHKAGFRIHDTVLDAAINTNQQEVIDWYYENFGGSKKVTEPEKIETLTQEKIGGQE